MHAYMYYATAEKSVVSGDKDTDGACEHDVDVDVVDDDDDNAAAVAAEIFCLIRLGSSSSTGAAATPIIEAFVGTIGTEDASHTVDSESDSLTDDGANRPEIRRAIS